MTARKRLAMSLGTRILASYWGKKCGKKGSDSENGVILFNTIQSVITEEDIENKPKSVNRPINRPINQWKNNNKYKERSNTNEISAEMNQNHFIS